MRTDIKKLSIGVPTYNNPHGLEAQLENLISQIKKNPSLEKDIEVYVSDNSNNENTAEIIKKYLSDIPYLSYKKNEINIGFDRNINQILNNAAGSFCWTLSDNDPIEEGGLKKVLDAIQNNPDLHHIIIDQEKGRTDLKVYKSMEELVKENDYEIPGGLISSNIFNRSFLPPDLSMYYGNDWIHLSIIFEVCAEDKVGVIPNVILKTDDDDCRWAKDGKTFYTYTNLHSILLNLINYNYSKDFIENMNKKFVRGLPHQITTSKLYGLKANKQSMQTLYKHSKKSPVIFLVCFFILIAPTGLLRIAKKLWKKS